MSEHKSDEMIVTGAHRAWAGEVAPSGIVRPARDASQRTWLEQPRPAPNSRHSAITRSLHTWSNYKSWTDKVRTSWDKDKGGK